MAMPYNLTLRFTFFPCISVSVCAFLFPSVCLSRCPSVSPSLCLSHFLSVGVGLSFSLTFFPVVFFHSVPLSFSFYSSLTLCPSISMSLCFVIGLKVEHIHLPLFLFVCLSVCLCLCLSLINALCASGAINTLCFCVAVLMLHI